MADRLAQARIYLRQFQRVAESWRPYRALAVMYLFESVYELARLRT